MATQRSFYEILNRIAQGVSEPGDLEAIHNALQRGEIRIETGARGISTSGDITQSVVITGDGNVVYQGTSVQDIVNELQRVFGDRWIKQTEPAIEYETWKAQQHTWIQYGFQEEALSSARFGQVLNPADPTIQLIERQAVWETFDRWYAAWDTTQRALVVLGDEGDGKTWAIGAWINQRIAADSTFPPVIFLGSERIDSTKPEDILTAALQDSENVTSTTIAQQMLDNWKSDDNLSLPWMICVLDGINQHHDPTWWRPLLAQLTAPPWKQRIALVITARTTYWQENFVQASNLQAYTIPTYNDQELNAALAKYHLTLGDLNSELHPLARRPRFLNMLVKHREQMAQSGDVTIARLMYEDWRDRYARKTHFPLNEFDFHNMLRDLAERYRQGTDRLRRQDLHQLLPSQERRMLEEVHTSGIFHVEHGKYKVQQDHLALGLALLLIERLHQATTLGIHATEAIAQWMEPHTALDIKGRICECAALIALEQQILTAEVQAELLFAWITHQNANPTSRPHLTAYFPISPASYFRLAERIWADERHLTWAQKTLKDTFIEALKKDRRNGDLERWQHICERWLGFVHRFNFSYLGRQTEEQAQESYRKITDRLGVEELLPGPFTFVDYPFIAVDNRGLLRMALVALTLISHVERKPFLRAITLGCVAEAITNDTRNYKNFAWVLRSSSESLWNDIQDAITHLIQTNNRVAMQAASRLLTFIGSPEALQFDSTLPNDLFPAHTADQVHKNDPCTSPLGWQLEDCQQCMERNDIAPSRIARELGKYCIDPAFPRSPHMATRLEPLIHTLDVAKLAITSIRTSEDHTFEMYEPALCVYTPNALATIIHRLIADVHNRREQALSRVAYELHKHALLFTRENLGIIEQAWTLVRDEDPTENEENEVAEWWLFELLLGSLSGNEQLSYLLSRPAHSRNLDRYTELFECPTHWDQVWECLVKASNDTSINRLLWFIGTHATSISLSDINQKIIPLLKHKDSFIRSLVLEIIYHSKEPLAIEQVLESSWSWNNSLHAQENNIGSLILCEYGQNILFPEIIQRIAPWHIGYAVKCRNTQIEEVQLFSQIVQAQWECLATDVPLDIPDTISIVLDMPNVEDRSDRSRWSSPEQLKPKSLPASTDASAGDEKMISPEDLQELFNSDFHEQQRKERIHQIHLFITEQHAEENYWFDQALHAEDFEPILDIHPYLIEQWIDDVLTDSVVARQRLSVAGSFYDALCILTLQRNPSIGLKLYWKICDTPMHTILQNENTKVWSLDNALFKAPRNSMVEEAWQQRINICTNDADLLEIVIAVQAADQTDWMLKHINKLLASDNPIGTLRAITLLGLLDIDRSYPHLQQLLMESPDSWIRNTITMSIQRSQRNSWARYWFHRFIVIPEDVDAWASFRVFLRCVDRRFWGWHNDMIEQFPLTDARRRFLALNNEVIGHSINKNEKGLNEQFLCQKIADKQLWPWLRGAVEVR